jgi:uncharacterized protein (DUF2147 family)
LPSPGSSVRWSSRPGPTSLRRENAGGKLPGSGFTKNAQNGKTYEANIRLQTPDVLKIEGCVLGGIQSG